MSENMYDAWDNGDRHEIRQRFSRLEELTRMARESGLWDKVGFPKELERFAALVAAAEREACAQVCDEQAKSPALAPLEKYRADFIAAAIRERN